MEIYIEPAKRAGRRKRIRNAALLPSEVTAHRDGICLTVEAAGIYDNSTYRYTIKLSPESLGLIYGTWGRC